MKNRYGETITDEFSNILSTSKRSPLKLESDRGKEWYNNTFQNFLKIKNIEHYLRFTDKGPSVAERVIRILLNLIKKPVFKKGNATWIFELPSVIEQYNNTIHSSVKMTPIQACKKATEKEVYSNLKDRREVRKPKFNLGHLVGTGDIKKVFSKGDSTNWSYNFYTITGVIHETMPSYRINFSPERFNEHLLKPTKLTLEENSKVMKKFNSIQNIINNKWNSQRTK